MPDPFLKWAGGKRWLVKNQLVPVPTHYGRYVEPFLGSGAVFFYLEPAESVLSDLNRDLIELYQVMRDCPADLCDLMEQHQHRHSKKYYYEMRTYAPRDKTRRAARFLYLNRTCWNGLYRVNLRGEFNVPKGTKTTVVFESDDFLKISSLLQNADLRCSDFESVIMECRGGDLLFIDPPYTVKHNQNNFLKYNEKIFCWEDQLRLKNAVSKAIDRGVAVVVTNADHPSIQMLYRGVAKYQRLDRHSVLAGDTRKRRSTTEALFIANISSTRVQGESRAKNG